MGVVFRQPGRDVVKPPHRVQRRSHDEEKIWVAAILNWVDDRVAHGRGFINDCQERHSITPVEALGKPFIVGAEPYVSINAAHLDGAVQERPARERILVPFEVGDQLLRDLHPHARGGDHLSAQDLNSVKDGSGCNGGRFSNLVGASKRHPAGA